MLKLIKWDLKNVWESTKNFNIVILFALIISLAFPKNLVTLFFPKFNDIKYIWPAIVSFLLSIYAIAGMIYITIKMVYDIRKNKQELLVAKKAYQYVWSKILVNILLVTILGVITILGTKIMERFATDQVGYFRIVMDRSFYNVIITSVLNSVFFFLCYVLSKSFKFSRKNAIIWTLLFMVFFSSIAGVLNGFLQAASGAQFSFYPIGMRIDTSTMNTSVYEIIYDIFRVLLILLYAWVLSKLIDKRFER